MAIVEQLISPEEYLKKEREGSREKYGKFEYFDGKLIEMGGASLIHSIISTNLIFLLKSVLSDSTQERDRGEKFQVYRELSSLKEYVLVSQGACLVERYFRPSEGEWVFTYQTNPEQKVQLASVQQELLLKDIYEGTDLVKA